MMVKDMRAREDICLLMENSKDSTQGDLTGPHWRPPLCGVPASPLDEPAHRLRRLTALAASVYGMCALPARHKGTAVWHSGHIHPPFLKNRIMTNESEAGICRICPALRQGQRDAWIAPACVIVTAPCSPLRRTGDCTCNPVCSLVEQIVGNSWLLIMYHALKSVPENRRKARKPSRRTSW